MTVVRVLLLTLGLFVALTLAVGCVVVLLTLVGLAAEHIGISPAAATLSTAILLICLVIAIFTEGRS
jgi:hypothetical protein